MQKAFDIHCHFLNSSECANKDKLSDRSLDFLREESKDFHVLARAFCGSFNAVLHAPAVLSENELLFNLAQKNGWIYQWVVLDPQQPATFKQAQELLTSKKTLGLKIISEYHGYAMLDYADEIFAFANEHKTVVMMHPDHILDIIHYADKYPNMKLIIAHLGTVEHIEAVKRAKHENIFVDTSGQASSKNNVIEHTVKQIGSKKIFFGTDTYSCAFQKCRVEFARIPEQDKTNILYNNALREFPQLEGLMKP